MDHEPERVAGALTRRPLRVALALSGGGSKGAFTVGALKVLRQKYKLDHFPIVSGTSTGALIGTMLVTNDWSTLVDVYSNVLTKHIVNTNHPNIARLFGTEGVLAACALLKTRRAIFDTRALERTIALNVDWGDVRAAWWKPREPERRMLLLYSAVDLRSGIPETFNNRDHDEKVLERALLASSNQPVLMDPVSITGREPGEYVDGGVREYLPLEAVFANAIAPDDPATDGSARRSRKHPPIEVDTIVAITTSPQEALPAPKPLDSITDILARAIELLNTEIGKDDYVGAQRVNALLRMRENAKKYGKMTEKQIWEGIPDEVSLSVQKMTPVHLIRICPAKHLDMNGLDFEPGKMRAAMDEGVAQALAVLEKEDLFKGVGQPAAGGGFQPVP